jgi:hypothetical protein
MAKTNTKLSDFFEGKRRRVRLSDITLLCSRGNETRIKLTMEMPLSDQPFVGTPDVISEQFALMGKAKSQIDFAKVSVEMEGLELGIFSTDTVKQPTARAVGATLQSFRMTAEGIEDKRTVDLIFEAYFPATKSIWDWGYGHKNADFFVECVASQLKMEEKPEKKKQAVLTM